MGENGVVTARAVGGAIITAKSWDGGLLLCAQSFLFLRHSGHMFPVFSNNVIILDTLAPWAYNKHAEGVCPIRKERKRKGVFKMKRESFGHYLLHLNARKKVVVLLTCVVLSAAIIVTGVLALAQYTGVIDEGNLTNPDNPKDAWSDGAFADIKEALDPSPDGMPFQSDGEPIKNPNKYPLVIRATLKEICTYLDVESYSVFNVPASYKPILVSREAIERYTEGFKVLSPSQLIWDETLLGPYPSDFHFFYITKDGKVTNFCAYRDIYDGSGNWLGGNSIRVMRDFDYHMRDSEAIGSLWFRDDNPGNHEVQPANIEYWFYSEDAQTRKTQWVDSFSLGSGDGIWMYDSSWIIKRPTLAKVVKNWSDAIPLVVMQTYLDTQPGYVESVYLKAPTLSQTPTANKWFYNEADGYFYYIGILAYNQVAPSPLDVANPVNSEAFFNRKALFQTSSGSPHSKELSFRIYGDAVEANKDAITTAWGLTFEPGSLGAKILGE